MEVRKKFILISKIAGCTACLALLQNYDMKQEQSSDDSIRFVEMTNDFPTEDKNLRKWDTPIIADLDKDSYEDLILNDHGYGVRICWNDKGKFSKPFDLIMGDLHGIAIGDYNQDNLLELFISRGGGSGSNARNTKVFQVDTKRRFTDLGELKEPLALMRGRTVKLFDGDGDGDLDLVNFAFPDKEKKGISENYIYENVGDGEMVESKLLPSSKGDGQKVCLSDFDGDRAADLIMYGNGAIRLFRGNGDLRFEDQTNERLEKDINDVTSVVEIDFDNDGDLDLFLTRGEEFKKQETFYDSLTQTWGFYSKRGTWEFDPLLVGDVLRIENLQSQWPYNDALYIGETGYQYDFSGETHSGKDIRMVSSNALGFPDRTNEDGGIHIGFIGNEQWKLFIDTWSPTTGIIKGVNNDFQNTQVSGLSDVLLENREGKFFDVSEELGFNYDIHTTGAAVADINQDGFQDLIVVKRGCLVHINKAIVLINDTGRSFNKVENHGIQSADLGSIGLGIETLDFDLDGDEDVIIGNERGKWHLFKNESSNGSIKADVISVQIGNSPRQNASPLGALVQFKEGTNLQTRRIGSTGALYSHGFQDVVKFVDTDKENDNLIRVIWTTGEASEMTTTSDATSYYIGKKGTTP